MTQSFGHPKVKRRKERNRGRFKRAKRHVGSGGAKASRRKPRQHWRSGDKKPQPRTEGASCLVGPQGLEPWTKGLCLPLRLSPPLASLWSGLYLPVTGWPSSLYTFPRVSCGGLARYWRRPQAPASTEFDQFYPPPACRCRRATHEASHSSDDVQADFAKSSALTN
jgi:hypothetical protein